MKTTVTITSKLLVILGMGIVMLCQQTEAQDARRSAASQDSRWVTAADAKQAKAKQAQPSLTKYELTWEGIETHQNSKLEVFAKEYKFSTEFENGDAPYFNAFEEELKPGKYTYAMTFIPNEIGEYKTAMADIRSERTDLAKRRREAIKSGQRDLAKTMYQRSNELREEATELSNQHMTIGKKPTYEFIKKHGQIVVAEDGSIKVYDIEKVRQDARDTAKEKQESERAENREGEEFENGNNDD